MSQFEASNKDLLESLLPKYQAEGFEVYVNPSPSILPPFMETYRPDAVALRQDKKIAIEVVRSSEAPARDIQDLKSLFAPHRDWELRIFYASPLTSETAPNVVSRAAISSAIRRVHDLKKDGHLLPSLVMAWATLEAIGRALLPDHFSHPQSPRRLVEVLAEEGYLTPQEADMLRPTISLRNAAVHGGLDPVVDGTQLEQFLSVLNTLADLLPNKSFS